MYKTPMFADFNLVAPFRLKTNEWTDYDAACEQLWANRKRFVDDGLLGVGNER
jgi:hypothetical protein